VAVMQELIVSYDDENNDYYKSKKKDKYTFTKKILTSILVVSLAVLFIFTIKNSANSYWVYLINFLVLPFVSLLLVLSYNKKHIKTGSFMALVLIYTLLVALIGYESLLQYKNDSIFAAIRYILYYQVNVELLWSVVQ
jgi:FtsH-binding integral membrane protein